MILSTSRFARWRFCAYVVSVQSFPINRCSTIHNQNHFFCENTYPESARCSMYILGRKSSTLEPNLGTLGCHFGHKFDPHRGVCLFFCSCFVRYLCAVVALWAPKVVPKVPKGRPRIRKGTPRPPQGPPKASQGCPMGPKATFEMFRLFWFVVRYFPTRS